MVYIISNDTVQNKACRYFSSLYKNASNLASRGDMGWSSCAHKQNIEACRLYFKIERTPEYRLVNKIFKWSSMHGKSWEHRFKSFLLSNNLQTYLQNMKLSVKNLVKRIRTKLKVIDDANWKTKVWNDTGQENGNQLRTYRLYKSNLIAEDYLKINMERSHRRIIAKFRSGSLPLQIEAGRYKKQRCH